MDNGQRIRQPDGSFVVTGKHGRLQVCDLGGGVLQHIQVGVAGEEFAEYVILDGKRVIEQHGRCVFFVDSLESTRMTTEFRDQVTDFFRRNRATVTVHILLRSKLLEMAVNVANLVVGMTTCTAYSKVEDWEAAGRREVLGFRRRPFQPG